MNLETIKTLIQMLEYRARHTPDRTAFTYSNKPHTFGEVWENVNKFGAFLQELGITAGTRVILALPNGEHFSTAFYGVLRVRGIAVPLFPGSGTDRLLSIAKSCEAAVIIAPNTKSPQLHFGYHEKIFEQNLRVVIVADDHLTPTTHPFPEVRPDDIAFLQYTSGSTGNPKGVVLSHANLITNMNQMIAGMEITPADIFVSWLPMYHDMGLILMTMIPFYLGTITHLLPTNLRDINLWLETMQSNLATFTAAPDFAYRLSLRHTNPDDFDLTSLRVALNAAEPVRAKTIHDFESAFHLDGVMLPGYGLAEATVGVSMWPPGSKPRVDERGFVSVGPPFPGVELKIVQNGKILSAGEVGEIAIKSSANSSGYFNNPEETKQLIKSDGYILSGDLGYLDEEGYLYIVGRKKNIIKLSGETISPREIEEIVDQNHSVRYSAAVGVDRGKIEGEQIYVFTEIGDKEITSEDDYYELSLQLVSNIHARMGLRPGRVYLLKPGSIPLTHNGKIQHLRLKEQYLDGSLHRSGNVLFPEY
jgi:acyl-CoA synthetase (AMP-forming)/AMP-acid ligase II